MAAPMSPQYSAAFRRRRGFHLVELFMAVAMMGIVLAVLVLALTSIKATNDLADVANGVVGTWERGRAIQIQNTIMECHRTAR